MPKPLMLAVLIILSLGFGLSGCTIGGYTMAKRADIDARIEAARTEASVKMEQLRKQEVGLLKQVIAEHEARLQAAADHLFKGIAVGGFLKEETMTRPERVMGQSIKLTAEELPSATPAAQAAAFEALKRELDEAKVSTEQLKAQYEVELGKARAEGEAKAKAVTDLNVQLAQVETAKVEALEVASAKERALQTAKDEVQDKDTADALRKAAEAEDLKAIKLRFSSIIGGLALLCTLGAIYSPVYKDKLGIAAIMFGLAAVGIWYLQGWHVALAVGLVVLALVGWAAKNHYIESKTATNVMRAVQAVKDTQKDVYDSVLKPKLDEWMTVYDSKTGETVPDKAAIAHVDQRLMETGDK